MSDSVRIPTEAWALIALVVVVTLASVAYLSLPEATPTGVPELETDSRDLDGPSEADRSSFRSGRDDDRSALPVPSTIVDVPEPSGPPPVSTVPSNSDESRFRATGDTSETRVEPRNVTGRTAAVGGRTEPTGSKPERQPVSDSALATNAQPLAVVPGSSTGSSSTSGEQGVGAEPFTPEPSSSASEADAARGFAPPVSGRSRAGGASQDAGEEASVPVITMQPSARNLSEGDLLSVRITIDGASNVGHTPFHVLFNPAVLRFISGTEGSFLAGDGQPTAFFASVTSGGASVVVGLSRLGPVGGISGSGDLCVLQFEVIGTGSSGLVFQRAKVRDDTNQIVPAEFRSADVNAS